MRKQQIHAGIFVLQITALFLIGASFITGCAAEKNSVFQEEFKWPAPTSQNHPWSRWWWLGSAVDKQNLTDLLTQYQQAGIGGVEICPIYGVKDYEQQFKDFLSPEWMSVLEHSLREGKRLNIGVDLTMGTGWPFGGPMVTKSTASSGVVLKRYELQNGKLAEPLPTKERLDYLLAVSSDGRRVDVTSHMQNNQLNWTAPKGSWTLYAVAIKNPVQKVKRAAPGGKGYVLDPYSTAAMESYLSAFDNAFGGYQGPMPRTFFHDSFEYYGATWTTQFFDEFQTRRGYDLHDHIEALFGDGPDDIVSRVMCDYHETINDLHLDYVRRWTEWCHSKGSLSRNQAHGAPANLIDVYAASDISETEIFRAIDEAQIPMLKFSSSAAHLTGQLASSESFTWLKEHFQTSLGDLKNATDFLFLTGVNHIFFHGIPYSPKEAQWPGWQFYASVNFGPTGGLWHDLPAYNAYVTRCQSILQSGSPDNDVLLYLPIYDFWHKKEKLHMTFTVHNQDEWLYPSAFYSTATALWEKGYTYDAVSDLLLSEALCQNGKVSVNQNEYEIIIVPHCQLIPVATMEKLINLARAGATVLFVNALPQDVPGLNKFSQRQAALKTLLDEINPNLIGKGQVIVANLETLLKKASVTRETAMDSGIRFVRRRSKQGFDYLFVNRSEKAFDGWMTLGKPAQSAVLMDPLYENHIGQAAFRQVNDAPQVYLQLRPGQSVVLRTFMTKKTLCAPWYYYQMAGSPKKIEGSWDIEFIEGGPVLPGKQTLNELASWTTLDDKEYKRFHGTARYTITFETPKDDVDNWLLDLGPVCHSARVTLNGTSLGTLWAEPFQLHIGPYLAAGTNTLQVDVTNLAANRIRDLDQRKVNWKYFYDINLVNINYQQFDASGWPVFNSGLLGPVYLKPLKQISRE